ncbi:MAG: phytoene/squalene synthase family protein [Actinomycetota bacterium]|nr:phytoene/squalene synthase family protein [Actinomycetota bacterium]
MSRRELDAAGIRDPALRRSYETCRRLHAAHGKTYYLATKLLPPAKRPYVNALYGFARYADEIVDDLSSSLSQEEKAEELRTWGQQFLGDLGRGHSDDAVGRAVVDTVRRWQIPTEHFEAFLRSMAMDLTVTEYPTYDALYEYVYGSAAVIGLQMVPILEPLDDDAYPRAMELGVAFQLANFVRDVGEDLDRGRVYLPIEDLERFGLTRTDLERRVVDERVRALLAFQIARVRRLERAARPGIDLLHPTSRPCIQAADTLYCGIVDEVEKIDYQVFDKRATVPLSRRLVVAGGAWGRAAGARRAS